MRGTNTGLVVQFFVNGKAFKQTSKRSFVVGQMIIGAIPFQLTGPVGIVKITGDVAQSVPSIGWWPLLSLTAVLSLNLAIINILPFPALDGGRVVLVLVEVTVLVDCCVLVEVTVLVSIFSTVDVEVVV